MLRLLELRLSRCVGLYFPRLQVSNNGGFSFRERSHDSSREATDWPIGGMRSVDLTDQLTRLRSIPDQAGIKKTRVESSWEKRHRRPCDVRGVRRESCDDGNNNVLFDQSDPD